MTKRMLLLAVLLLLMAAPTALAKGSGRVQTSSPSTSNCFHNPGEKAEETASIEACGFPGFKNTGPDSEGTAKCAGFPSEGGIEVSANNTTIEAKRITGQIVILPNVKNTVINRDCITINGGDSNGTKAIELRGILTGEGEATVVSAAPENTKVTNSVIRGANTTTESIEESIANNYIGGATLYTGFPVFVENDLIYNCGECVHGGQLVVKNSFVDANGRADKTSEAHYENIYTQTSKTTIEHNTLFNPEKQTATIFAQAFASPCTPKLTVENNFLAGSGAMIYPCANSTGAGSGSLIFKGNRLARCKTAPKFEPESGGTDCTSGPDTHGYFPFGGFFFVASAIFESTTTWTGNFWDDNLEACNFNTGTCPS